ncbi:MAG: hypothetical protein QXU88_01495 [Candidatus Woesearchaeota archaeon]
MLATGRFGGLDLKKMDNREKILSFIRLSGPVLPVAIAKELKTNILFASAMLSELVQNGHLKASNLKIGGSPLYYLPGQEVALEKFVGNLHEKDRKTFELLREKKVLRDSALDPLTRVSLRRLKDFAVPLSVTVGAQTELFWKLSTLTNEEAEGIIRSVLEAQLAAEGPNKVAEGGSQQSLPELEDVGQSVETTLTEREAKRPASTKTATDFLGAVLDFFSKHEIKVLEQRCIKKNTEYDFIIELPSPLGKLTYYCKAKSKSRIAEADLAAAFVQGQLKKLPIILLANGSPSKKVAQALEKDFKGMLVKKL